MPRLSSLLLGGLAEPFLHVTRGLDMTAVTEVQRSIQGIINKCAELFEVIVVVAPVTHTHLDARVPSEAAVSAWRLVFAVWECTTMLRVVLSQQLLLTFRILVQEGLRVQLPQTGH